MQTIQKPSGRKLHDRATRGEALTDTEWMALQAWYEAQDAAESALLQVAPSTPSDVLRAEVDAVLVRLQKAA